MPKVEKSKVRVITSLADVPDGYEPASKYCSRASTEGLGPYHSLLKAARKGEVPSVKIMRTVSDTAGQIFFDADRAAKFLARNRKVPLLSAEETQPNVTDSAQADGDDSPALSEEVAADIRRLVELNERIAFMLIRIARQREDSGRMTDG